MKKDIKFSVVIPTKDRLDLLKYAVKSVLQQDYQNWEIIISDNCSKENIGDWVSTLNDSRIICVRQNESLSVCDNWNKANDLATGDYIILLGDDDALLPEYFSYCLEQLEKFDYPELVYHSVLYYMQPNVSPYEPDGWVKSSKKMHPLTLSAVNSGPYIMSESSRIKEVTSTMNFWFSFGFNAQFYLYSKKLVSKMEKYGKLYQPPYPDTYAANMMMLVASSVLVIPKEMVILGITPKSFGWYNQNNKEKEGMVFHKDAGYREYAPKSVRKKLLNICEMQTASLATLALLYEKFPERKYLKVKITSYYDRIIERVVSTYDEKVANEILEKEVYPKIAFWERFQKRRYAKECFEKKVLSEVKYDKTTSYADSQLLIEDYKNNKLQIEI